MTAETITPERQQQASQVLAVFNSLQQFLATLKGTNERGDTLTSEYLKNSFERLEEASFWACKHVMVFGIPPRKAVAPTPPPAPDAAAPAPVEPVPPEVPHTGTETV